MPPPAAPHPLVHAARELAPRVRALAAEGERLRRLPPELVEALRGAGIFRMLVPATLGGAEVDPSTLVRALEELSRADGSAGWCAMIGATSAVVAAYLPEAAAREIYGLDPLVVTGGVFAPSGTAAVVDGGYRVRGRWAFASGCEHCAWLMVGAVVTEGGKPRLSASGVPQTRLLLFPRDEVEIVDTWDVSGLRGTGSHTLALDGILVPAARAASIIADPPREAGPLYRFPVFGLLALGGAAVALGIARAAIDELRALAATKVPTAGRKRLGERGVVQVETAEAEALVEASRAFLFDAIEAAWQAAAGGGPIPLGLRARLRLAATHAVASAAKAVDLMYGAGGGTAIYASSPLQRCFRDVHVITQHMMVAPATLELIGRVLLGIDVDTSLL